MALQKRQAVERGMPRVAITPESLGDYWAGYSNLVDFLSLSSWPDGTSRQTGTLMLMHEDGLWKCWLNDKAQSQATFVSAATLPGLVKVIDSVLVDPTHAWRLQEKVQKRRS